MKRIVQLRGLNASGKTTAMRGFAQRHNLIERQIDVGGIKTWVMTGGEIAVVGRYPNSSNFGGCDSCIKGKQHLFDTLGTLIEKGYSKIAFEGFLFSGSFRLGIALNAFAKNNGYEYVSVLMDLDYSTELERLFRRNGGKEINLDSFDSGRRGVYRTQQKLEKIGCKTIRGNAQDKPIDEMWQIVEGALW